jgi:hypothetical protein
LLSIALELAVLTGLRAIGGNGALGAFAAGAVLNERYVDDYRKSRSFLRRRLQNNRQQDAAAGHGEMLMADMPTKPVPLLGASGNAGGARTPYLTAAGWTLRPTDIAPFPDPMPEGASFARAELSDEVTVLRLAEGGGPILHFARGSVERPLEEVLGPNIRGLYHVCKAARREQTRLAADYVLSKRGGCSVVPGALANRQMT